MQKQQYFHDFGLFLHLGVPPVYISKFACRKLKKSWEPLVYEVFEKWETKKQIDGGCDEGLTTIAMKGTVQKDRFECLQLSTIYF